jgi:hypothetical protein
MRKSSPNTWTISTDSKNLTDTLSTIMTYMKQSPTKDTQSRLRERKPSQKTENNRNWTSSSNKSKYPHNRGTSSHFRSPSSHHHEKPHFRSPTNSSHRHEKSCFRCPATAPTAMTNHTRVQSLDAMVVVKKATIQPNAQIHQTIARHAKVYTTP